MRTDEDRAFDRAKYRERSQRYKDEGKCPHCGKPVEGYTIHCDRCLEYSRMDYYRHSEELGERRKTRYERLKSQGICVTCGKRKASPGVVRCIECRLSFNRYTKKRNQESGKCMPNELRGNGYCYLCLSPLNDNGHKVCDKCYERLVTQCAKMSDIVKNRRVRSK